MRSRLLLSFGMLFLAGVVCAAQKDVPSWVSEVGSRSAPSSRGKAPAAILLSEEHVSVDPIGAMAITTRKAIKVLTREGQRDAVAEEYYYAGGRKVKELRAWLVAPNGFIKTYDKNSVADLGAFGGMELYNDIRVRKIAAESPEIGAVFVYEAIIEERPLFAEDEFIFQHDLPTAESKYVLTIPQGWKANSVIFNHETIQPAVDGSTYVWALRDLPYREHEEHGPSLRAVAPRLEVSFDPSAGPASLSARCFHSWGDVSRWHSELSSGQDTLTPEIIAKTRELTANAATEYAKIQALGHYVQSIRYVAIEMDESHGGGYKPHTAASVFQKQYGDCKDKANLLKTMLKSAGIESSLVAIFSGDRTFVREEWPSPKQFNHMILAIRVGDKTIAPSILNSETLGRLLIFDPTSETTPVGDLPWYEQGSFALVCANEKGALLKMPVIKGEADGIDVNVAAALAPAGGLTASMSRSLRGQPAAIARAAKLYETPDQFRNGAQRRLSRASGITLSKFETQDGFADNTFRESIDFESATYAQFMQQRMLIFSASVVEPSSYFFPRMEHRTEPIILRSQNYRKQVRIKLPSGYTLDEIPVAAKSETDFGGFTLNFKQDGDFLVMDETLHVEPLTLPADQYVRVKHFFDEFIGADQQHAVLIKN